MAFVQELSPGRSEDEENKRAMDGLQSMKIEEELFASLDGQVSVFKGRARDSLTYVQVRRITKPQPQPQHSLTPLMAKLCNEISVLRRLTVLPHSRIARLLECYQTQRHVWVVSEFISGNCLRDVLVHTCLGLPALRGLCRDLASALLFLHGHDQHGLVHGDLRPENIFFTETGMAKLTGFGQARFITADDHTTSRRHHHHHLCHAEYAAPELLTISTATTTTKQSDVWALGIVLFESAHSVMPFTGTSFALVRDRAVDDEALYSPDCDQGIVKLIRLLLHKQAEHRPVEHALVDAVAAHVLC